MWLRFYHLHAKMRKLRHTEGRSPSEVVHTVRRWLSWESMWAVWLQSLAPWLQHPAGGQPVAQRTIKGTGGRRGRDSTTSKVSGSLLLFSHSVISSSLWPQGLQCSRLSSPSLSPGICSKFPRWLTSQYCPWTLQSTAPGALVPVRAPYTPNQWARKGHPFRPIAQALPFFPHWMAGAVAGDDLCLAALVDVDLLVLSFGLCLSHLPLKTCWSRWSMWVRHTQGLSHTCNSSRLGVGVGVRGGGKRNMESWKCPPTETKTSTQSESHSRLASWGLAQPYPSVRSWCDSKATSVSPDVDCGLWGFHHQRAGKGLTT